MRIIPLALTLAVLSLSVPTGLGADFQTTDPAGDAVLLGLDPAADCYAASADILAFSRATTDGVMTVRLSVADLSEAKLDCAGVQVYGGELDVRVSLVRYEGETVRSATDGVGLFARSTGFGFALCAQVLVAEASTGCLGEGRVDGTVFEWVVPLSGTAVDGRSGETLTYDLRGLEVETDVSSAFAVGGVNLAYDDVWDIPPSTL